MTADTATHPERRSSGGARILMALASLNVLVHAAGLAFLGWGIRPGCPLVAFTERRQYLSRVPWGWTAGWASLMLCALALVAFCAGLARMLRSCSRLPELARLAVVVAVAGAAIDLLCDAIQMVVIPRLSAEPETSEVLLRAFERLAGASGLIVANGAYSLAVLLLTICLGRSQPPRPLLLGLGYAVFGLGMILVGAGLCDSPWLAALVTAPTLVGFCAWCVGAAWAVERAERCA